MLYYKENIECTKRKSQSFCKRNMYAILQYNCFSRFFYQKERIKLQRVDLKRIFRSKIANEKYVYVREKREAEMILYRA